MLARGSKAENVSTYTCAGVVPLKKRGPGGSERTNGVARSVRRFGHCSRITVTLRFEWLAFVCECLRMGQGVYLPLQNRIGASRVTGLEVEY